MISDEQKFQNLKRLHAKYGGRITAEASFSCPVCGVRPILVEGNRHWNDGMPIVECLCLAPFSPRKEIETTRDFDFWQYPMLADADQWGMFVAWKPEHAVPSPEEDDEEEAE